MENDQTNRWFIGQTEIHHLKIDVKGRQDPSHKITQIKQSQSPSPQPHPKQGFVAPLMDFLTDEAAEESDEVGRV